jgi:hypothetical protein
MMQKLMKGLMNKNLKVKKAPNVTGTVCIHFPNPEIQDFQITGFEVVDIFGRIGMSVEDVKKSNIQALIHRGDLIVV